MEDMLSDYFEAVESVLEENPVLQLEKLLEGHKNITPGELIQLSIKLKRHWNSFEACGIEMCVVLTEEDFKGQGLIYKYDFTEDIRSIIQSGNKCSNIYYLNCHYEVGEVKKTADTLRIEKCSGISKKLSKIVLHVGTMGIDILADGMLYKAENFLGSYKDLMDAERMLYIYDYEKLIQGFYEQNIKYDINKRYFLRKDDVAKEYREKTVNKYPKLLRNKPEEFFEIDFVKYLKDHCQDAVIKEYTTASGDRYDVLVLDENNNQVYVFEIKWLGRSITTGMNVFENYNSDDRAIAGAYQLLDYITNADTYKKYFLEFPVYCAILLVFDARDEDKDIEYPKEVKKIPRLDLNKRLFMEKNKVNASSAYYNQKR